jgi:NitT/TauT family transport system substrate-binding protein
MMRNRSRERNYWLTAVLAVGIVATGLGYQPATLLPRQAALVGSAVSLRLMSAFGPASAGEMLAARAGLFERENLHVELRAGGDAGDPIVLVGRGTDMFGVARADSFLRARGKGAPIVAFAAGYIESPAVFYVLRKSGQRTPQDFIGRRVGRRGGDDTALSYTAMVERVGLPRSRISEVPVEADLSMLLRGDIDVWPGHIGEEDYALSKKNVEYTVINPGGYGIHLPGTVYFTSERTIAEQPQVVQKFLNGVIAGWQLTYADYSTSVPLISAFDEKRLTADYVRFGLEHQREYMRPLGMRFGEFNEGLWRSLEDILLSQRLLDRRVDMAAALSYDFLRDAYRRPLSFGK